MKVTLQSALDNATRHTKKKGAYHKTRHAFKILETARLAVVRGRRPRLRTPRDHPGDGNGRVAYSASAGSHATFAPNSFEGRPFALRMIHTPDPHSLTHESFRHDRDAANADVRGRHPGAVPAQPRRRGRLRLSRRRQHADPPGADPASATGCAPSCRGTSRAAASRPRATPAAPARSASASPPAAPAPPTSSPASPTPSWTRVPIIAITGQVGTPRHRHRRLPGDADRRGLPRPSPSTITWCSAPRTSRASSRRRSTSPPPAGPARSSSTCPRTCRTAQIVPDCDPPMNLPGYRPYRRGRRAGAGAGAGHDPPGETADHLRRRRHHRLRAPRRTSRRSPNAPAFPSP